MMPTPVQKFVRLQRRKQLSSPKSPSVKVMLKKKKPMSTRSAKAKGRKLQTWVVDKILSLFPVLTPLDVKSTPMGVNGVDVQLSTLAQKLFPYDIECKNTERTKTIYNYYEQAIDHTSGGEPLVVIKMNRQKPLAIVDAEHFMELTLCQKKTV
jgi:hypothetical protein